MILIGASKISVRRIQHLCSDESRELCRATTGVITEHGYVRAGNRSFLYNDCANSEPHHDHTLFTSHKSMYVSSARSSGLGLQGLRATGLRAPDSQRATYNLLSIELLVSSRVTSTAQSSINVLCNNALNFHVIFLNPDSHDPM